MSQEQLAQLKAEDPIAYNTYLVEEQQRQSKLQAIQQEQQVVKSEQLAKQADLLPAELVISDVWPPAPAPAPAVRHHCTYVRYSRA